MTLGQLLRQQRHIPLQLANVSGQLWLLGMAFRRTPARAVLAATLLYGSTAVWARELWRDG